MSDPTSAPEAHPGADRDSELTALFANLVLQHTEMALMLLGKAPNPQSGRPLFDLDHARLVIDQLEMLEAKTRGNLSKEEDGLLKQSLMTLRLAFVEAVDAAPAKEKPGTDATPSEPKPDASSPTMAASSATPEEESKKKFTKKY
jgi:hypothetical protein